MLNKSPLKFYEQNKDKAKELVAQQILELWTYEEIKTYWYALGYDVFFMNSVVKPFFLKSPKN